MIVWKDTHKCTHVHTNPYRKLPYCHTIDKNPVSYNPKHQTRRDSCLIQDCVGDMIKDNIPYFALYFGILKICREIHLFLYHLDNDF